MSGSGNGRIVGELREELDAMLSVLAAVGRGESGRRARSRFSDDHPVGALAAAFNDVAIALESSRTTRLAFERQLEERVALIEQQRHAIAELSTPAIEVLPNVLTLPIVGSVDSERAVRMNDSLLGAVIARQAKLVVIDVTALEVVDTAVADHFLRMARSVRLLGADCVLSGLRPSVASTLVAMGVEIGELRCFPTLRAALVATLGTGSTPSGRRPGRPGPEGGR